MKKPEHIKMEKGIFYLDGNPKFFLSADYPYYRDAVENWSDRLDKLRAAHIDVITFYVPWRHHAVEGEIDFTGKYKANKNVVGFLHMCHEKGLYVVVKPGPFIHAETDFGGLPDFVSPEVDEEIEAMLSGESKTRSWHKVLPAPLDKKFSQLIEGYFKQVEEMLVKPYTYPAGPVIAMQILNEGVYSDAQHPVTEYDYSPSSVQLFRERLAVKYGDIAIYNEKHASQYNHYEEIDAPQKLNDFTSEKEMLVYLDWAEYQSDYMAHLYQSWGDYMSPPVPYILNLNPPHDREQGYDDWFNRLEIEKFTNQHYGYTNWIGVVSHDTSAFNRYLLLTKRGRGPNLEENWGFSKLYDFRYKYTAIPFFQTVMAVAAGATGYNVYTGVSTDQWDDGIDTMQQKPYPDCSPVSETGELTDKYYSLRLLNRFFADFGTELMESKALSPVSWGIYNGYAQSGCWGMEEAIQRLGRKPVHAGRQGFDHFQTAVRALNTDYQMVNIETEVPDVLEHAVLVQSGGFYMSASAQQSLLTYVEQGGVLILVNDIPVLDEQMEPCDLLRVALFGAGDPVDGTHPYGKGKVIYTSENWFESEESTKAFADVLCREAPESTHLQSDAQVWLHQHPERDLQFFFILGLEEKEHIYTLQYKGTRLEILLPAKSSAIVALENGMLAAGVVKGIHEYEESSVSPVIRTASEEVVTTDVCDFYFAIRDGKLTSETALNEVAAVQYKEYSSQK